MTTPSVPTDLVAAVTDRKPREVATFGAVHLEVTDLGRSTAFYREIIGLHVLSESPEEVRLGAPGATLVVLHTGARTGFLQGHSGLYHLAIHPPAEPDFARILLRILQAHWPVSPTDHIMSKALYLLDPDGITVEITLETPRRMLGYRVEDGIPWAVRADGSLSNGREPLDVRTVLETLPSGDSGALVPAGTKIGHVHLYVGDLADSYEYYKGFGFNQAMLAPKIHMGDLGGGGLFNHRIAMNTWQGPNAPQSPAGTARMRHFTIDLDSHERLDSVLGRIEGEVEETESGFLLRDPSRNAILLTRG